MLWANLTARVATAGVVLPLLLRRLEPGDAACYLLLGTLGALPLTGAAGFSPTFVRFFGYALAGRAPANASADAAATTEGAAFTVREIAGAMHRVYLGLALAAAPVVLGLGAWLLRQPVAGTTDPGRAWLAWLLAAAGAPFAVYTAASSALLQGTGHLAREQRWNAVFNALGGVVLLAVLAGGGGLLALVGAGQAWTVVAFVRLRLLAARSLRGAAPAGDRPVPFARIWARIWPPSWRSLVGTVMSLGVIQGASLAYAQVFSGERLASFLLGLRLIALVSEASRAPFYGRIPDFVRVYAGGDRGRLRALVAQGMRRAHAAYAAGVVGLLFLGPAVLAVVGAKTRFPARTFWIALGAAFFVERFGAMHVQVVSLANRIIWHWTNGISGAVAAGLAWALAPSLGEWSLPVGLTIGYLSCYTVVGPLLSYRTLGTGFLAFERRVLWSRPGD